ncbi:MAG: ATP-binding protein [Desulfosudaceae bacterium]
MHNGRYKRINQAIGKAIHRYDMIADGDRICVGVSGGKDSLTLLWFLQERLARIPIHYALFPCYVDPGFSNGFATPLADYCRQQGWPLRVEDSDCGPVAHSSSNRENPCFLCSRLRRKRLFEVAAELGCNKLALGHNKDDIIESLFLNMCYAGEISTMLPVMPMFGGLVTIIRPLTLVDENQTRLFAEENDFPAFDNPCPTTGSSQRRKIKIMLQELYRHNKKIKGNIFRAMGNVKTDYLLTNEERVVPPTENDGRYSEPT